MKLIIEKSVPNMIVHYTNSSEIWASSGLSIYLSQNEDFTFKNVINVPGSLIFRLLGNLRFTSRALRLGIRNLRKFKNGTVLVVANRNLYRFSDGQIKITYSFSKGLSPLREGWCEDDNGNYYLAEYFLNNKRNFSSELLKSTDDGESWQVIHSIPNIRHIHCVQYDPYSHKIYIGTGDNDNESSILYSGDGGNSWEVLGDGDQLYRTVSLLFTENYIYWGGDAPTRQNYIVRYNRKTKNIEKLVAVNGTVFSSIMLENGTIFFSTTDEGNSEGRNPTADRKCYLWATTDGTHWNNVMQWNKDFWPYFMGYGKILLPHGQSGNILYFTPVCLKGANNTLVKAIVCTEE